MFPRSAAVGAEFVGWAQFTSTPGAAVLKLLS
jgi:hypothetical protein